MTDDHECDACGGADVAEFIERQVRGNHGRAVLNVFGSETTDAFSYTIGNDVKGLPELLLVGTCQEGVLLNLLSDMMFERGRAFDHMEMVSLGGKFPVCAVGASDDVKNLYTIQATASSERPTTG